MGDEPVHSDLEEHDHGATDVFPHLGLVVLGQEEQVLDEVVDMQHKGLKRGGNDVVNGKYELPRFGLYLRSSGNELVDTGNGVGSNFGAAVFEKLQELWDENVEGPVELIRVQHLGIILAHFLQCPEGTLHHVVVLGVQLLTERR